MNSVHEQCPKSDSETVLSPKTCWVHQVLSLLAQLAHPGARRRAQARACLAVSWALRPCCGSGPRPCRRRRAPCRGYRPQVVVSWAQGYRVVAWPPGRVATQLPTPALAPCHNTPRCIATKTPHSLASVTIHHVYCNTLSPAARLPMSQYTAVYCDTNLNLPATHCNTIFPATIHFCNTILPYCNTLTQPTPCCNTLPASLRPCHDTIPSLTIQLSSSPSSPSTKKKKISLFFFSFLPATGKH